MLSFSLQVQEVWKHILYTLLNKVSFVLELPILRLGRCMFPSLINLTPKPHLQ